MEMKDKITLKIVYTSDIHGNVLPINYSDNSPAEKGLLKLITAINSIEKENRILIDLGDSIQGSPLMYFHQLNREKYKNPIAQLFNYAK
ncbi:MAG TPA: bifunctional metallophosphatase/5'-nucleotidase, partial [Bacillota bacterium]|nr:bifunctional metallophosphatase/5'-nucleotidase [Bacillota bacterium]